MPALRPYKVFISHAWNYSDDYNRVVQILKDAPSPSHRGIDADDTGELTELLRDQMPRGRVLIICGVYVPHSD